MTEEVKQTLSWTVFMQTCNPFNVSSVTDNHTYMLYIMKDFANFDLKPLLKDRKQKCAKISQAFKSEGGKKSFGNSDEELLQSIDLFNRSIAAAPINSPELYLAYSNKSTVLFKLRKYKECLKVMDRYIYGNNFPVQMKANQLIRYLECLILTRNPRSPEFFKQALLWIQQHDPEKEEKLKQKVEEHSHSYPIEKMDQFAHMDVYRLLNEFNYRQSNEEIPSISSAVALKYNKTFGRHFVATQDIKAGEIIAKNLYSDMKILSLSFRYLYCWLCYKSLYDSVPCDHCVNVLYCSEACKQKSWDLFHNMECQILDNLMHVAVDDFVMFLLFGIRATAKAFRELGTVENIKAEWDAVDNCPDPRMKGFSADGKFYDDKHRSLYSLSDAFDKIPDLLFKEYMHKLIAFTVFHLVNKTAILGEKLNIGWHDLHNNERVVFLGRMIYKLFSIWNTNGFSMSCDTMGSSVIPSLSFLNHSCFPNVTFSGKNFFAVMPIRKGEQLFYSYVEKSAKKSDRITRLRTRYNFYCQCIACKKNWPIEDEYPSFMDSTKNITIKRKLAMEFVRIKSYVDKVKLNNIDNIYVTIKNLSRALDNVLKLQPMPYTEAQLIMYAIVNIFSSDYFPK